MARLTTQEGAQFTILDDVQIYDEAELDRICARHAITDEATRLSLWRILERAGKRLRDQTRLQASRTQISRLKQELQLGMRLSAQLGHHVPDGQQLREDNAGVGLNRYHLAALREGERRVCDARSDQRRYRLEDASDMLSYLSDVYEEALSACAGSSIEDPEETWRGTLRGFYTHTLARAWVTRDADQGERFLADCRMALDRAPGGESEKNVAQAAPSKGRTHGSGAG